MFCVAGSRDTKEEIRQRVGILDVVSEYVAVKRSGKSYKGLCPFHAEKTPSFTVSEEFQTWHCFGCGEHGDVFSFLMKIENLTFAEALERLAKRAGVELEHFRDRQTSRRELLGKLNALAAAYYTGLLKRTPIAIEYLHNRGLAAQTIEQFRLGYAAPAWDGLVRYLTGKGVTVFDKTGKQVEQIDVPEEKWTANVSFGGADMKTLFITASKGFYSIKMRVKGANPSK